MGALIQADGRQDERCQDPHSPRQPLNIWRSAAPAAAATAAGRG